MVELFHARWGGELSLEQELDELAYTLPAWLRPLWKGFVGWLKPYIRRAKINRTMTAVDKQAKEIGDNWVLGLRQEQIDMAVKAALAEHPGSKVEAVSRPDQPTDLVMITHPPNPNDKAQMALGFGAIELKVPFPVD